VVETAAVLAGTGTAVLVVAVLVGLMATELLVQM
jgi:hypothetical protein